jgi:hypothetical protein
MLSMQQTVPIAISSHPTEHALTDRARDFITERLKRGNSPEQIAAGLRAYFDIEIGPAQVIPFWKGEFTPPTQTGHRQDDKESVQFPADAEKEPLFTVMAPDTNAETEKAPFSIAPDPAPVCDGASREDGETTQTGRRQEPKSTVLTDEVKTFIVKGLARYETPTRVAASVKANFGIEIDRRQVFAYDPAGSRPPAKRWIDLHAATRAKFTRAVAEIGVAQKVVRLRMLDRFANRADEAGQMERACRILDQAAKECGGFYERFQRPKGGAVA